MPTKKKEVETTIVADAPIDENVTAVEIDSEKVVLEPVVCGHINRHSFGPDNKHDYPTCDLEPGHTGDHHGVHKSMQERERFYKQTGELLKVEYDIVDRDAWWTDMAGTPAEDLKPEKLPSRNKKTEILQAIEQLMA